MKIIDMNIVKKERLPCLDSLSVEIPLTDKARKLVIKSRRIIGNIIRNKDKRQLLIVGPCSLHNPAEMLEMTRLISGIMKVKQDQYYIVMRVCFDKPRTRRDWMGYSSDPHLDGSCDIAYGYRAIRQLMSEVLALGVPIACEMLDISHYNIVSDMVSYAWVGARDSSSSITRKEASSISAPVGVKNSNLVDTVEDAVNALDVITQSNVFSCADNDGYQSKITTSGNQFAHIILRGGKSGPNFSVAQVKSAREELRKAAFIDRVLIDCSHGNSNGDYKKQIDIFKDIHHRIQKGEDGIIGVMMEVYLDEGKQSVKLGVKGAPEQVVPRLSVTDKCLSFADFEVAYRQVLGIS